MFTMTFESKYMLAFEVFDTSHYLQQSSQQTIEPNKRQQLSCKLNLV